MTSDRIIPGEWIGRQHRALFREENTYAREHEKPIRQENERPLREHNSITVVHPASRAVHD